jgi:hypothetical protein
MRKLVDFGLKYEYEKNGDLVRWFKSVCCLALIPIDKVDGYFEELLNTKPDNDKTTKFMDYLVSTYFEGNYPVQMWNHFETDGTPRTNNNLEGYNNKLNKQIFIAHPDIFKAISKL